MSIRRLTLRQDEDHPRKRLVMRCPNCRAIQVRRHHGIGRCPHCETVQHFHERLSEWLPLPEARRMAATLRQLR